MPKRRHDKATADKQSDERDQLDASQLMERTALDNTQRRERGALRNLHRQERESEQEG